ncbi:efflux RND transporter permease subunit [Spirulina major CS-329]|uniref:efflux RND transporter permease subunit n=1 Tax=Spirulina TaxID=1154 RepID=UPI00232DA73A|nr:MULTISPECIES: efflux RND transporter permease subunit [Spirulina]MDB9496473.1 efflux RND transporter permease subunit [Spirulina subsalsa CS-330]MDB9502687.1 efflux RND transporter permease subunit [Spirulina major CS-329]
MFVNTFIKRPVVAIVFAIVISLIGGVILPTLPIAQYPEIAPPQVQVTANYTGASAEIVENTVTNVLEQEINGVEGVRYISSSSSNNGTSQINITFDAGRDLDLAAVDVQNRIATVQARLPEAVQRTGVSVSKQSSGFLMALSLYSEGGTYDTSFLSNYADLYVAEALKRIQGVAGIQIFGERRYAMRLWVDPQRLASRGLTMLDVTNAVSEQNFQIGAGRLGQSPNDGEQQYQLDLESFSRFTSADEFEEMVLATDPDSGSLVQFRDVGRVELGAEDYNTILRFRGNTAVGLGVSQLSGSNALEVAAAVKAEMARLADQFPPDMTYAIGFDTTEFVEASMTEVVWTLIQAIVLVVLIIFVFLQDWRTTVIPAITIPASLIGTFIFVKAFGFSINALTLFGLTLATGMVVDDAIIVVENIDRLIQTQGMRPREAAIASMQELTGAVIATSLVLMAVFVPVAFFPGSTGALYRQFALTIAFSIAVSTFLALTFTPAISGVLLRQGRHAPPPLQWLFDRFNSFLDFCQRSYADTLRTIMRFRWVLVAVFAIALAGTAFMFTKVPSGFLPEEDQGYFITLIQAPEGVSLNYTSDVVARVESELLKVPEVRATFAVTGFSFTGSSANNGIIFSPLKPWSERRRPDQSVQAIIGKLFPTFMGITEARVFPVNPPPIRGLGTFGGFSFQLQDRRGVNDLDTLVQTSGKIIGAANQNPGLQRVFTSFAASTPKLDLEINRGGAKALQVPIDDLLRTLQTAIASRYVNDFTLGQRNYRVYVQADQQFRDNSADLDTLYVRSRNGRLYTVGSLVKATPSTGAQTINHFNLNRSIEITGSAAPGMSSGDAIAAMEAIAAEALPPGLGYEWSGTSAEEVESGGQAPWIFGLGLVFVFLVLAAQYENFFDPFIIMLAVPLAILGALLAQSSRGLINDVYCQVGLVMLIGLASKNSILIVEFANQLRAEGFPLVKAAIEASRERLRPILMTAISTLCGIFPLVIATGAGAGSRQSLGTAVFGGMFVATFLTLFMVPTLYVVVMSLQAKLFPALAEPPRSKFEHH